MITVLKGLKSYSKVTIIGGRLKGMDAFKIRDGSDYMKVAPIGTVPRYKGKAVLWRVRYECLTCPEIKLINAL